MEEFKEKVEKVKKETWFTPWTSDEEDDRMILNEEGLSLELISKSTSLTEEEIEKL